MPTAMSAAVTATPKVASTSAGAKADRSVLRPVPKPLSKRMTASASVPMKKGDGGVVELEPEPVFPGQQPDCQESEEEGSAEPECDPGRKDSRHDEPGADQDRQVHGFYHQAAFAPLSASIRPEAKGGPASEQCRFAQL